MVMIAALAFVEAEAQLGHGVNIWHFTHIREGAIIGSGTTVGSHCYIDKGVTIGGRCKIQSGCLIYRPAVIGFGVFIGPGVRIINDKFPRATDEHGYLLTDDDWKAEAVTINAMASIGAGAIIMPGVTIGEGAQVGAGAVVTHDVPDGGKVSGVPARLMDALYGEDEDDPGFELEGVGG